MGERFLSGRNINSMKDFIGILLVIFCLVGSFFFTAVPAAAAEKNSYITDVALVNSESDVLAFFTVLNEFTPEMEKGIKNGISVTFTFFLELYQNQDGTEKRQVATHAFNHTLNYDSLKQDYSVEIEEKSGRIRKTKSFTEAQSFMTMVHDFKLCQLNQLQSGISYKAKIRARLAQKKLPLNFQHLIPFWKPWDFETDWYEVVFTYDPPQKVNNPANGQYGPAITR